MPSPVNLLASAKLETWTQIDGFVDLEVQLLPSPMPHRLTSARKPRNEWTLPCIGEDNELRIRCFWSLDDKFQLVFWK